MKTFLLGNYRIVTASTGRSRYGHTFGGPHDRQGTSRADCQGAFLHLLHRLDLTDPAVPIDIPGIRWLPLYYCFDSLTSSLGYQLTSEKALTMFFPDDVPKATDREKWPDKDYPLEFTRSGIKIARFDYDPTDLKDAFNWAGVLASENYRKRIKMLRNASLPSRWRDLATTRP